MADSEKTRASVSEITYLTKDGESHKTPVASATVVRTSFSNGTNDDIELASLAKDILKCATLQGLSIKLQRSFASAKGDVNAAIESYMTVKENLLAGIWASKREGSGPRLSILADAVAAALVDDGQTVDDARMAGIVEKLKDDDKREAAMSNPKVKMHYERIKAERAMERAKAAAEAASASTASLDF